MACWNHPRREMELEDDGYTTISDIDMAGVEGRDEPAMLQLPRKRQIEMDRVLVGD